MTRYIIDGLSITPGYPWSLSLTTSNNNVSFPANSTYIASIKQTEDYSTILGTLSSANGNFSVLSNNNLLISMSGNTTSNLIGSQVVFDLVRTDTVSPMYVGIKITVPLMVPITSSTVA